jgi:hypothetical protein
VDTVLESGMDVRSNPRLNKFYLELVERVSRIEHPTHGESATNGAQFVDIARQGSSPAVPPQVGFSDQKFEPSPLDELSKIVLTPEEDSTPGPPIFKKGCAAVSVNKIELRGFQLGMTLADVKARIPDLRLERPNAFGETRSFIHVRTNRYLSRNTTLKGVISMAVYFFDGRISSLALLYDDSIKWNSPDEFVTHISDALALPRNWSNFSGGDYTEQLRVLSCSDVSFIAGLRRVASRSYPVAYLHDIRAIKAMKKLALDAAERKRRAEEQRKKAFKP